MFSSTSSLSGAQRLQRLRGAPRGQVPYGGGGRLGTAARRGHRSRGLRGSHPDAGAGAAFGLDAAHPGVQRGKASTEGGPGAWKNIFTQSKDTDITQYI